MDHPEIVERWRCRTQRLQAGLSVHILKPTHSLPIGENRLQTFNVHEEWQRRQVGDFHCARPRGQSAVSGETDEGREIFLTGAFGATPL